jgi:DNA-binding SARP family transcriptional activator/tetratricopeptide (TPR) repeat protein
LDHPCDELDERQLHDQVTFSGEIVAERADLTIGVLGSLEVTSGGRVVTVPAGQMRTLLVSLVLAPEQPVSADLLVERLWPDRVPVRARGAVHTYVARLRRLLGSDSIETARRDGYQILAPTHHVDLWQFRELLHQAGAAGSGDAELRLLRAALALWRGRPFADVESVWLSREVVPRLIDEWFVAVERRIDLELEVVHPGRLVPELRDLIAEHPFRESLWLRLILALHRSHRRVEALDAYRQIRAILTDEFGIDPSEALQQVHRAILLDGAATPERSAGLARAGCEPVRELPHDIASFCDRGELAELDRLLSPVEDADRGLTTIVAIDGAPGTGKTTLAVHWARRVAPCFPDLQLYVNLRGYGPGEPMSPSAAAESLLRGLGVPSDFIPADIEQRAALLRSTLAGRRALVLLDNARDADQVRPLLPGGESLVIITSRSQLRGLSIRDGAHRVTLGRLTADESLVMLATVVGQERVSAEAEQAARLVELCDRLPLALAIVAERAQRADSLCSVVRALLDEKARLDVFGAGESDPHTDLRAALSWSYRALDEDAAAMFRKLGLHPANDIELETAAALAGLPVWQAKQSLDRLAAAHLVEERRHRRFELHDLIRRYAAERAEHDESPADRDAAVRRTLDWYLHAVVSADAVVVPHRPHDFVAPYEPSIPPPLFASTHDAQAWFEQEYDCLRSVVGWAAANGWAGHAWRIAIAAATFFDGMIPWCDGIEFYESALRATRLEGERVGEAFVLNSLGCIYLDAEDWSTAERYYRLSLDRFKECGHLRGEAMASGNAGMAHASLGNHQRALRYSMRALLLYRRMKHARGIGMNLDNVGLAFAAVGKHRQAIGYYLQADAIFREMADHHNIATTQIHLGASYLAVGAIRDSIRAFRTSISAFRRIGNRRWEAFVLVDLGKCVHLAGHPRLGRAIMESALATFREFADRKAKEVQVALDEMAFNE